MKTHIGKFGNTLCGMRWSDMATTEDISKVDCKKCIKAYPAYKKYTDEAAANLREDTVSGAQLYRCSGGKGGYGGGFGG